MDDTAKDVARLVVAFLEVGPNHVGQRHVASLVTLHNLPASLVDGDEVIVFI